MTVSFNLSFLMLVAATLITSFNAWWAGTFGTQLKSPVWFSSMPVVVTDDHSLCSLWIKLLSTIKGIKT